MDRPNILLITTDQQRFDGMALNGNDILRTPNLDALAARGVNFTRAYSTCPSCIATRRSWLTGLYCGNPRHGLPGYEDGQEFFPQFTLPGLLGEAGYQTQLIGKFHVYPQRKRYGFDNVILSEQLDYRPDCAWFKQNDYAEWVREQGEPFNPIACGVGPNSHVARPFQLEDNLHHTSWCVEEAIEFVTRKRDPSGPWFLHLSFWAPHPPLVPPKAYWDRYEGRADWHPVVGTWAPNLSGQSPAGRDPSGRLGPYPDWMIRDAMAGYYGLINHIDDRLAYLFSKLFEYGNARKDEPVWIVFASDHGEMLGDHHLWHKQVPYEGSTHVPFFVTGRNVELSPAASDALVGPEDLLPTLCELAGVEVPGPIDGKSVVPVVAGRSAAVRELLHGEHAGAVANHWLIDDRYKYCWFARTGEEQLFDLRNDPRELHDLSSRTALLAPFRKRLAEMLEDRTDYGYDASKLGPLGNRPPRAIYGGD